MCLRSTAWRIACYLQVQVLLTPEQPLAAVGESLLWREAALPVLACTCQRAGHGGAGGTPLSCTSAGAGPG